MPDIPRSYNPKWDVDEEALLAASTSLTIQGEIMHQMIESLARGIPVTLTMGGEKITTFYPDGTSQDHGYYDRRYRRC